jgi:hypothetical protein
MSALSQSVQYAIVALATQHRTFVEEKSATASVSGNLNHQRTYSLHNYGRAITSLNNKLVEASNETRVLEETLITCLLFICFNTLQGNDVATLTHLESGLRICSKYSDALQILSSEYAAGHGPIGQLTSTFKRLDLQAAFYLGSYQIKSSSPEFSLCPQLPPNRSMRVYSGFETLQRAKDCLEMLVLSATSFMRSMAEPLKYLREDKKTGLKYNRALYYRDMYLQRLQDWFESFQLSDSLQLSPIGDNDKMQLAKCRISYAVTLIALSVCLSPEETEYDQHLPFFFEILTNAESILGQSADSPEPCPGARPLFDLEMSLIHPLYFTALKCRDYTARYRSIDLLYKCGKEGVWDGEIMARISLHVVALEECERTTEIITGELQVPEDKRVCGTSLNVIRDGKMVWVECSTRRWFPREWGMSGIESDKIALRQELAAEYAWDFSETLLKW